MDIGAEVNATELRLIAVDEDTTRLELEHLALAGDDIWRNSVPAPVGIGWEPALGGLGRHMAGEARLDAAGCPGVAGLGGGTALRGRQQQALGRGSGGGGQRPPHGPGVGRADDRVLHRRAPARLSVPRDAASDGFRRDPPARPLPAEDGP